MNITGKITTFARLLRDDPAKIHQAIMSNFSKSPVSHLCPDRLFLSLQYRAVFGKKLNFKEPKTFNEKLNWLKLYDRNPEYCKLVDKHDVKQYVAQSIGEEYIIPTLAVWDCVEDINLDALPEQFVLKCTHDSGSVVICRDKSTFDIERAKAKLAQKLKKNMFWHGREWPYKCVKPRVLAEQYMEDEETAELRDYKFFCFDGKVKTLFVATDRQKQGEEVKFDFFDCEFNRLPIKQGHPNAVVLPDAPACFEEMKRLAQTLSAGVPHVRVDFYEVNGKVYFGELTFFHFCGMVPFEPEEWDYKFGEWLKLPEQKGKNS